MIALLILSFTVLTGYIAFYVAKIGLPYSHSYSYYALKQYKLSWLFPATLFFSAFALLPVALEYTPQAIQFTAFLTLAPVLFTAFTPDYENTTTEAAWHMRSAKIAGVFSIIWAVCMAITVSWWLIVPVITSALLMYTLNRFYNRPVLFLEYFAFLYPYIILLLMLIS